MKSSAMPSAIQITSRAQVAPGRLTMSASETTIDAMGTNGTHGVRSVR